MRDMAKLLGAPEVTVRRDLVALARSGLVRRTHGGAVLPIDDAEYRPRNETVHRSIAAQAIAAAAKVLIQPGDSVVLGSGEMTLALAQELTNSQELTVITNSLMIIDVLVGNPGVDVLLTGGSIRPARMALAGPFVELTLCGLRASVAFVSGDGLSLQRGLSSRDLTVATADRAMAGAANRIVVLAERSTIGSEALFQVLPCGMIHDVITDANADNDHLRQVENLGIRVQSIVVAEQLVG